MDEIFKDLKDFCLIYIDNVLIYSKLLEEHKKHLEKFKDNGIILNPNKIELEKRIIFQPHITTKIKEFSKKLKTLKELQNLLGLLNYGRQFVKIFF
ncbi:DNA-directed DNA polymerase [Handroanthus impetiginosus]|uniref:DNA-directed DNA polymerase n=1 Tax=Handroanthus impetiginosus TaxID=429701 RepID=A0A2G9I3G7_9LAMI|nr:DNA-directed DNA polymerase [Handroanthus impetiginosus]